MVKQNMKEFDINQGFEAVDADGIKKMRFLVTFLSIFASKPHFLDTTCNSNCTMAKW